MTDFRDQFYEDYLDFKADWLGQPSPGFAAYFAAVAPLAALPVASRVLEIGFGDGQFLRWCISHGHCVTGVEIVPALITRAHEMGIECLTGPVGPDSLGDRMFDAIVAFDVLEHMPFEQIADFFEYTKHNLKPGGLYVVRFPNGASPFGYSYQASDITHKSILSLGIMKQLARRAGLQVDAVLQPRPYPASIRGKVQRWLGYAMQDLIGWMLKRAYYGGQAHLQPNLLLSLKRTAQTIDFKPRAVLAGERPDAATPLQSNG